MGCVERRRCVVVPLVLVAVTLLITGCSQPGSTSNSTPNTVGLVVGVALDTAGNFYLAGYTGTSSSSDPCYWKNGTLVTTLPVGSGNSIFTIAQMSIDSAGNIYILGDVGTSSSTLLPCYWGKRGSE